MSGGALELRPPRFEDAEAVVAFFNRLGRELHGTDDTTVEELTRFWSLPTVDLERDYERAGMSVLRRKETWEKELRPATL